MRQLYITLFTLFFFQANSQQNLWSIEVSKDGFMSQLDDGKIFLKDKNEISLINNETGEIEWKNNIAIDKDPKFFEGVPFMYFEGKSFAVVDASSGKVIAESKKTSVIDIHYFWDQGRILLELNKDKNLELLNIDLNDLDKSWTTTIGKVQKSFMGLVTRGTKNSPSIANDGTCVLVDKEFIMFVSSNGEIKNRIDFKDDIKKQGYNSSKDVLYVLEDKKKLHFIDVNSAENVFTTEYKKKDLQLEVLGDGQTIGVIQKDECHILDAFTGATLGTHSSKDKIATVYNDPESGKYFLLSKKLLTQLNVLNAEVVKDLKLDTDFMQLYKVGGNLYASGRGKINQISTDDLSVKYAKSATVPPVQKVIELNEGRAYTYQIQNKFQITIVDHDGKKSWSKEIETHTRPSVDIIGDGLLIISGVDTRYLNIEDGKSIWKKSIKTGPSFNYVIDRETDNMVMYSDKKLYFFDTSTGKVTKSDDSYKFKDFDYDTQAPQLLLTDNKIFLKGSNTVYVANSKGEIEHQKHYKKADNASGLMKLANIAVTAAAVGTGNAGEVMTVYSNGEQVHKGGMVDDMNSSWAYSDRAAADRQARQNRSSSGYPFVFTKMESGDRGLIFLNPATSEEMFNVVMKEKAPNYILDEVDGVIFYLNKTELQAIDIK